MSVDLKAWIGRQEERRERLEPARTHALLAALEQPAGLADGDVMPPLFHWLHFWDPKPPSETGPDGHPARGGFLPPVALPRRMWAGGRVEFVRPLRLGEEVRKLSTIDDVQEKSGRTGALIFVTVRHELHGSGGLAVRERQDLVYREAPPRGAPAAAQPPPAEPEPADWREEQAAGPVLLFRFSALTLNSHRIHYDRPYAVEEEGYQGLVVHGPLQATLMTGLAGRKLGAPARLDYRAMTPAVDLHPISVCGRRHGEGADIWVEQHGRRTMTGTLALGAAA
ncbi:FAS1-like dehydratase domain-containing protein [Phenylobacterium sp.]|jgi:3-methylfumaryl-CoA hydratase|uniref:FAS1-like dehydratase domain-containing protein n=1 Tax=Phenylobacterium sp. TaxID=1871053 RepID=UPI002F40973C